MNENLNNGIQNNIEPEKNDNKIKILLIALIVLVAILLLLGYKFLILDKKDTTNNNDDNNKVVENNKAIDVNDNETYEKIDYEIKKGTQYDMDWEFLYINGKKVGDAATLNVLQYKDVLIVEKLNPGPDRKVVIIDKDGKITELDYMKNNYSKDLISYGPESYEVKDNYLYVTISRQYGNGYLDWYCKYDNTNEIAEYTVRYEYLGNSKFGNKEIIKETKISELYSNELKNCNSAKSSYDTYLNNLASQINTNYTEKKYNYYGKYNMNKIEYNISLTKENILKLKEEKIAEDVLMFFVVNNGNGGYKTLYYITKSGDVYSANVEESISKNVKLDTKKLTYKNIVNIISGVSENSRMPIFIDIDGNMYFGENNTSSTIKESYKTYLNNLASQINTNYTEKKYNYYGEYNINKIEYNISLTKENILKLKEEKIAEDVLMFFVVNNGNGGYKTLYYITKSGDVYSTNVEESISKNVKLDTKKLTYKNIVNIISGVSENSRMPIFIDIDGNMYF